MSESNVISGHLTEKDLKRLTGTTRTGTVGPTTVYYAGLTAPIISAGVTVITRAQFANAGLSTYWIWLLSAFVAAFAGISWYLIFMRWSYRQSHGRGEELTQETTVELSDAALIVRRKHVISTISWPAISEIRRGRSFLALIIDGSPTLLIPDHWFGKDTEQRQAFQALLESKSQVTKA
ncbi:MAG: YcxB family protein [Hyphomonadaceae bacterium]